MNPRVFSEEDFDQVAQAAWDSVVPIMALHGKNLRQHGTGTLFGVADHSFLVTAAHVALEARDTGAELCTMTRKDGGQVLTIGGKWVVSAKRQRGQKDPFDVAVLKLAKECTVHLTARLLLRLDDVSLQPTSFDGV